MRRVVALGAVGVVASSTASAQAPWSAPPPPVVYSAPSAAEAPSPPGLLAVPRVQHAMYLSVTSLFVANAASLNYSYRPLRMLAISAGVGVSGSFGIAGGSGSFAYGGQAMAHLLVGGDGAHAFEFALGGALVSSNDGFLCVASCGETTGRIALAPTTQLGYRYHPMEGGLVFRTGLAWELGLGVGVNLSFGGAF